MSGEWRCVGLKRWRRSKLVGVHMSDMQTQSVLSSVNAFPPKHRSNKAKGNTSNTSSAAYTAETQELSNRKLKSILNNSPQYHRQVSCTDSPTCIGLLSQSFTASSTENRCGRSLRANAHHRGTVATAVCPARITHCNLQIY